MGGREEPYPCYDPVGIYRVLQNIMADNSSSVNGTRKKWLTVLLLFFGIIPFIATSVIPLIDAISTRPVSSPSPSPTVTTANRKAELEGQEKGYQAVLQREPDNVTALEGLVNTRLEMVQAGYAKIPSVIDPLEKLAKAKPDRTDYLVLLGQAQQYAGNREAAAQAFQNVLATKPGDIKALQGMASLLLQEQRPEAAIALLQDTLAKKAPKANQIQPGSVDVTAVQLLLGELYTNLRRYDEAIALFDQLIKKDKNDFRPVVAKAIVFTQQGKTEEAKPLLQSAAALAPAQYKDQINQLLQAQTTPPPKDTALPGQPTAPQASPSPSPSPSP